LITGRLIALIDLKKKKGRWGGGRARRESRGGAGSGGQREEEERKGEKGEADRWGRDVSGSRKRKRGGREVGRHGRRVGPLGLKGNRCCFLFFLFFFFSNSIFKPNSFQIQIKPFKLFLKNFINFLETTQTTKNHASQLMMHIHLLSLSLLNYI
jgi:hypothetical protein